MREEAANSLINTIEKDLNENGFDSQKLIAYLKDLRPYALKEEDPLVTKVIRLAYEHLDSEDGFFVCPVEENDEGEEMPVTGDFEATEENFNYFLQLLKKSDNEMNREEIKQIRTQLKEY